MARPPYTIEFYEDANGDQPVRRWLKEALSRVQRQALGAAMNEHLQHMGIDVCETEFGRQLGGGLFEFRLRLDADEIARRLGPRAGRLRRILLRVFCHAYGEKLLLLLAAYDKASDPSARRQRTEISIARTRLKDWKLQRARGTKT